MKSITAASLLWLCCSVPLASASPLSRVDPAHYRHATKWKDFKNLFVFGDSYTATGFDPTLEQPNPSNPLGNPEYPGWTSANGPNWVGFLTTTYNESYIQTYNLAYGGATVDSDLVKPYMDTVLSLKNQVEDQFIPIYSKKPDFAPWLAKDSLFAFFIGINDVGNSWWLQNATLYDEIFNVYTGLLEKIYQSGGRNFLLLDVPPVDRSPMMIEQGPDDQRVEAEVLKDFNGRIKKMAKKLERKFRDIKLHQFSTHNLYTKALDNVRAFPETAVYKNTTAYCDEYQNGTPSWYTLDPACGIPVNEYFWLNSLHPTFPVHNTTARAIAKQLGGGRRC
ncbi:hypothetical protein AJ80_07567 [Polytolypa hystricis UAMH7299]|uniref:Uncharacterized protein n=1 Tax=Polytolypa hystricis (strain UAMH7299) TaxID=1447883 RepID=A0A2B7XNJ3_POLH7|nr:hypothetical protein AJ80_07567 [Polytolypa hystricis UAMH7299]